LDGSGGSDGVDLSIEDCGCDKIGIGDISGVDTGGCDTSDLLGACNCSVDSPVLCLGRQIHNRLDSLGPENSGGNELGLNLGLYYLLGNSHISGVVLGAVLHIADSRDNLAKLGAGHKLCLGVDLHTGGVQGGVGAL